MIHVFQVQCDRARIAVAKGEVGPVATFLQAGGASAFKGPECLIGECQARSIQTGVS